MYSSYLRFKKFISALTIALFAVVNPLLSFAPVAYASEGDAPDSVTSAPADAPADQPSDTAMPSDAPAPTDAPAPSDSPASTDIPAVSDAGAPIDPTPAPEATPVPAASSTPADDSVWQILPNGKALTKDAVNMSTTYVAPQNSKVTVHFTQLPDTAGNLTIQEIKLTADQQQQLGALSDTAYDISSNMENGTFKYDLTLPNPAGNANATVKYAEDVASLDDAQTVTQKKSVDTDEDTITITGLNHFTVFFSADESAAAPGSSETTITTNPTIAETAVGQIGLGTLSLHAPAGFQFDTTSNVNVRVSPLFCGIGANKPVKLTGQNILGIVSVNPTTSDISVTVNQKSAGVSGCTSTITFGGLILNKVKAQATNGTPLATGNLTVVGSIGGATFTGETFTETAGAYSASASTISASPSTVEADGTTSSLVTVTVTDQFGNPLSGKTVSLAHTSGAGSPVIGAASGASDLNGHVTFSVTSTTLATDIFTATNTTDAGALTHTATITFVDTTAPAIPTIVSPASGLVIKSSAATLDWSDSTDPSSPVTYQYQSSLSNAVVVGNNGFTSPIYTEIDKSVSSENATGTSEGVYYWQVRACDSVGNCSNWSGPWKVTIDNTAPVIASASNVTAEATSSSGATVSYSSPATSDNVDAAGTASCLPASGNLFAMGDTTVTCNATDVAGNIATPATFTVTVHDTTAPVINLLGDNPQTVELGGAYIEAGATASDNIDGDITGSISTTGSVNTSLIGTYTMHYNVSDTHSNPATEVTRTVNVVDTTKPAVPSLVSPADGSIIKPAAATLDWTDETDLSNPVTYQYQSSLSNAVVVGNNGFTSILYGPASLSSSQIDATGSADGVYYWQVRACDALNNCSDWSNPWQVTIDGTAPVTTDSGTDTNWHNSDVTVNLNCTDNLSGCDVTYYTTDGSTPTTSSATGSSVVVSTTGVHTIKYFSVDQAGNEEAVKTAANTVKIDKVTPDVPVIGAIISPTNNPIVSWTWGAVADADSGLQHYQYMLRDAASNIIDSGFTTLTTYSHTFSVNGVYTFFLRAIDIAGNKGTGATSSVTVDITAPDNPSPDNAGGNYASPVTVALTSNDQAVNGVSSNPTTIYYTTDGTDPATSITRVQSSSLTINQDTTLKAIAYDAVGNASGVMTEVYYVAPVITDVTSSTNSNPASERVITWTTNINSDSRVVFGTTSVSDTDATTAGSPGYGYGQSSDHVDISPNGVVTHTVTITGLNSFTTYFYRVISAETLATLSAEYSFGTEATDGTPGPDGDSGSSSGSSDNSGSSTTGKVLGATTKAPTPTPTPDGYTGTPVALGTSGTGSGSYGVGSGVAGTSTPSASPTPSVSPSPEASPEISPSVSPTPQNENGKAFQFSWWWLLLIAAIAGGIWYWRRRNVDSDIPA